MNGNNMQKYLKHAGSKIKDYFLDGWYWADDPTSADRARLVACNYTGNIIGCLTGGNFWTAFLLILTAGNNELRDSFVGTLSIVTTAVNLLPMFSSLLLERFPKRKRMLVTMRAAVLLINVVLIGLVPLCPVSMQARLYLVLIMMASTGVIGAIAGPGISAWHMQSVPPHTRSGYFSLINMTVGVVNAVVNLLAAQLVDGMGEQGRYTALLILRGIAMAVSVLEVILYAKVPEYPYEPTAGVRLKGLFTEPFKQKKYLLTAFVPFLWTFGCSMPGSYYSIYILEDLKLSFSFLTLIGTINIPVVLLLTPLWRKLVNRLDWFRTLAFAMAVYSLNYFLQGFTTRSTSWLYPAAQIWIMVFGLGINITFAGIPYVNLPKENQTLFLGFYSTVNSVAGLLGVSCGKWFIMSTQNVHLKILGLDFCGKQLIMLVTGVIVLSAALVAFLVTRNAEKNTD